LSTSPFGTTTQIRPLNRGVFNKCSMAAESTSAARIFRRNSMKFFPSLQLSVLLVAGNPGKKKFGYKVL
jgi:hypothetical protein